MKNPPADSPVFSLLSGSGLDSRKERQLRRSLTALGATVDASRNDRWNRATTHLVAVSPVPSVKWVCAIASAASVHIATPAFLEACIAANDINLDASPFELSFVLDDPTLLPASMDALWAGRIWAPAYTYWRQRSLDRKGGAPLCDHRVLILGQLKPRGAAGLAAPSNKIVTDILTSAGATVVKSIDEDPTFAIAAPGLDPSRIPELQRAIENNILCLGSAFLIDLVCRASADPSHYVMFESQKALCGPLLDLKSCKSFESPLPVSHRQLVPGTANRSRRTSSRKPKKRKEDAQSPFSVQGPDDISIASPAPRSKINANTPAQRAKAATIAVEAIDNATSKVISPFTPAPQPRPGSPCQEKSSSQQSVQNHESKEVESTRRRRVRKRSRNAGLSVRSTLQFASPKKAKAANRNSKLCEILGTEGGRSQPPSLRQTGPLKHTGDTCVANTLGTEAERQGYRRLVRNFDEANVKPTEFPIHQAIASTSSPKHCKAVPPQREQQRHSKAIPHVVGGTTEVPSQTRSKRRPSIDVDIFSQADANSQFSRRVVHRDSALLKSNAIRSVEDGYHFVLGVLGGEPSKRDVDGLVKSSEDQATEQISQDSSSDMADAEVAQTARANVDESPALEDEEVLWFDDASVPVHIAQNAILGSQNNPQEVATGRPERDGFSGRNEGSRRREQRGHRSVDIFRVAVPRRPITLSRVLQPKFAKIQNANWLLTACGNEADDEACQCEVKYIDWVLGAERLIGCSPEELNGEVATGRASAVRRVCLSLAESGALSRFGSAGGLSDVESLVLTGVCTRLVIASVDFDPSPTLVSELLSLREKQNKAGFDSLEMVVTATNPNSVPLRHRAVATIWSVLTNEANNTSERKDLWSYFNIACSSRLENLFSISKVPNAEHLPVLRSGLNWILESSVIVGYVRAIQVDFIAAHDSLETTVGFGNYPENWDLICQCLEGFSGKLGSVLGQHESVHDILRGFLCNVAVHLAHRVWKVSEKVLSAFSKAISFMSKLRNENCYCSKPALFASRFQTLNDVNSEREAIVHHLKTPCDCYFFLGWLYATYGTGNAMKRAMGIIRNGSAFTNTSSPSTGFSRAINHHVGLTLTVADSLSSASESGEYFLCRTLTSKCPRLETLMDRYVSHGKEDDLCWRATVEATGVRCRILLAKGASIHIYTNWLAQNVVGAFHKVKKSGEKRPSSVTQREALRVQESVFTNLALLTLATIREVTDLLHAKAMEGERESWIVAMLYVEKSEINVLNFVRIASDIVSQMRSSPEEMMSRSKCSLLCALLSVISNEIKLVVYACSKKIDGEKRSFNLGTSEEFKARFGFIEDSTLENMLVGVIKSDVFDEDYGLALKLKCSAARALGQLIELQGSRKEFRYREDERRRLEDMVRRAVLDGRMGEVSVRRGDRAEEKEVIQRRIQNRARIEFWSESFMGRWGCWVMENSSNAMHDGVIRVAILGVAHLVEDDVDEEYRVLVRRFVSALGRIRKLDGVIGAWGSEVHLLGSERVDSDGDVEGEWKVAASVDFVGRVVTSAGQGCSIGDVKSILQGLEVSVRGWLEHCKKVRTVRDGLLIYSHVVCVWAQMEGVGRGGSKAGWIQGWLVTIRQAVQKLHGRSWQGRSAEMRGTLQWVQERVMGVLGTMEQCGRDLETRVCVVRLVKSFAQGKSTLLGLWRVGRVEVAKAAGLGRTEERRRFERNVREWQKVAFHSAVEDELRGSIGNRSYVEIGFVLGRFVEAMQVFCAEKERCRALLWQGRQMYGKVVAGEMGGKIMAHAGLAQVWGGVERLITESGGGG